jgi:hypothetical protein
MKKLLLNLLIMAYLLLAGIALATGAASVGEKPAEPSVKRKTIEFHEISFEIPERGWERSGDESSTRIQFIHKYGKNRGQSITIWPVAVPPEMRGLSSKEHSSKYFEAERHLPRYPRHWEGFVEEERVIGDKRYPTMRYQVKLVTFPALKPWTPITDGLFLLYFPQDFETRQRFYVLMWQDIHPADEKGKGLTEFDAIVSSFRVRPLKGGKK